MNIKDTLSGLPSGSATAAGILGACGLGGLGVAIAFQSWQAFAVAFLSMAVLGVIAFFALKLWDNARKKRDAARFEQDLDDGLGDDGGKDKAEQEEMRKKLLEGIQQYEKSGTNVYESPWLVLVGPPSAGKSVLLQKCGLVDQADALKGVGGTRGMNWWFVDADVGGEGPIHAVVLDMAGAVFMDQRQEGRWDKFLDFLRQHRRYEPLNGVLLVVSVQDLLGKTPEQLTDEAGKVRAQLERIRTKLDVRFPVWVVVTKCDLIDGFKEFFDTITNPSVAAQMLGWSKPGSLDEPFNPKQVREYIGTIVSQMRKFRLKSLSDMVIGPEIGVRQTDRSDTMYGLPVTFEDLGNQLEKYLEVVFARKKISTAPPFVRGIYFTSSERKGASISKALRELGIAPVDEQWPDRAFFNKDIFSQKIFQETMLVTPAQNVDKMRRKRRLAAYGTGIAAALILGGLTFWSWSQLSAGVRSIQTFYAKLAQPGTWATIVEAAKEGKDVSSLSLNDKNNNIAATIPQLMETSQAWASESPGTPLVFQPLGGLIGAADLPETRKKVHARLMRDAVVRPLLQRTYAALSDDQAFIVDTPAALDRFKRAVAALDEVIRFQRTAAFQGKPPADSKGDALKLSPEPTLKLRPMLEFLALDAGDKVAADWLKNGAEDQLQGALTGYAQASGVGKEAESASKASRFVPLTDETAHEFAVDTDPKSVLQLVEKFGLSISRQTRGDTGLLTKIGDLHKALADAKSAMDGLEGVTRDIITLDQYTEFEKGWRTNADALKSTSDRAIQIYREMKLRGNELESRLNAVPVAVGEAFVRIDARIGKVDDAKSGGAAVLAQWKKGLRPEEKDPAFDQFKTGTRELASKLVPRYPLVDEPASDKPAVQHAMELVDEVTRTLALNLSDSMAKAPSVPASGLIWAADAVDAAATGIVQSSAARARDLRAAAGGWNLPPGGGGSGNLVTQTAASCEKALNTIRRRAIGTHLDRLIVDLGTQGAGLGEAIGRAGVPEQLSAPPLSQFEAQQGRIQAFVKPDTVTAFFQGWDLVRKALSIDGAAAAGTDAPIVNRREFDQRRDVVIKGVDGYRALVRRFWETDIAAQVSVTSSTESWPEFLNALKSVSSAGPATINQQLADVGDRRSRTLAALGGQGSGTGSADWTRFAPSSVAATNESCRRWLDFWMSLPTNPLDAREALRARLATEPELIVLARLPYWESLAERGVQALARGTSDSMGKACERLEQLSGFPIDKGSPVIVRVNEIGQAKELICQMSARPAPAPSATVQSDSPVLRALLAVLNAATPCTIRPRSCEVATALERLASGSSVTVQPVESTDSPHVLVQSVYPFLSVSGKTGAAFRFNRAIHKLDTTAVGAGVVWRFSKGEDAQSESLTVTFTNPWYLAGLIAHAGKKQPDGSWLVEIKSLKEARGISIAPDTTDYSLSLKITLKDGIDLPKETEWPSVK